ncbi:photosystem II reaction center PSB29 protein [Actinidia rufa]|uniref:Photosystem II reaction center PSB29 protein n=1 Tax=Actinidia rufa TaxID=165716 RepID=A0A7J0DMK7_9ERIC|nr:photosystem II reaction center PSB29 protein [Actinidia rufa]
MHKHKSLKLCTALNINKRSVDRDLDVYRNLLSKLVQAKELLKEYVDREKKKIEERAKSQKASEAITTCLGDYRHAGSV